MSRQRTTHESLFVRTLGKIFLSAFVVLSFVAYALHERAVGADQTGNLLPVTPPPVLANPQTVPTRTLIARPAATHVPTAPPPPTRAPVVVAPSPKPVTNSGYQDGSYKGPEVDAFYGYVQVQAVIQNGKIADVQFLDYPRDRRTSQRINSVAVPYLQQEALQVQSARVDIISGATLTSEAFIQSLQSALANAKNGS